MLKDKAKISVAVDTLDVDNSINIQDNKENINSYAEWLAASAAHDAFYAPHPQGGLYKRDMNAIQFLYIIASSDRDFICRIMDGMRSGPIGTGVTSGTLRTFVFEKSINFNTEINKNKNFTEQRIKLSNDCYNTYILNYNNLTHYNLEERGSFFNIVKGRYSTFRFKDWSDYKVINQLIGSYNGLNNFQLIQFLL